VFLVIANRRRSNPPKSEGECFSFAIKAHRVLVGGLLHPRCGFAMTTKGVFLRRPMPVLNREQIGSPSRPSQLRGGKADEAIYQQR
jgi:hypothetical protein